MSRNTNLTNFNAGNFSDGGETKNDSFSEKEVKDLLNLYSDSLSKLIGIVESYKQSQHLVNEQANQEKRMLEEEINNIKYQMNNLTAHKNNYEQKTGNLDNQIESYKKNLNENPFNNPQVLDEYFDCFSKALESMKAPSNQLVEDFMELKRDMIILYNRKDEVIELLKNQHSKLEEVNSVLKKAISAHEEEKNKMKFCIRCHSNFSNKQQDELICLYHPGELKYYSCNKCGADEFYSCCKKCRICSAGCKKSKHVSEG